MAIVLKKSEKFEGVKGPILTIVMDGVGIAPDNAANAFAKAYTPTLDRLMKEYPTLVIKAHGSAVGLPSDDDMGNSEVGHNALGSGQVFSQGAKLVSESIESGKMFASETWQTLTKNVLDNNSTLHFLGLFSDGNVHSHINHLKAMIEQAKTIGVSKVRIHILLDGRDVGETSALDYIEPFEAFIADLRDASFDIKIASGGGRMKITMDRYEANWAMVEEGWKTHVLGEGRYFASAAEAVKTYREETGVIDQDLPPFVIAEGGKPVGTIEDNDSVIFFNFRGDRSIEISTAFDSKAFTKFDRVRVPNVMYAGMLEYDGDLKLPKNYLVSPPSIKNTLSELLVKNGKKQFAISETQKYGHVTYFWNGNRSEKFSDTLEIFEEIPSDVVPFEQRPWMKAAEVTDRLIDVIASGEYDFIRCNFPNGDMVGHTGNMDAVITSVEAVDLALARLLKVVDEYNITLLVTADHGNADEMYEKNKKGELQVRTAHSLNQVPFIIYDKNTQYTIKDGNFGLANVAPTVATIFGLEVPECWEDAMI